jgi:hypothetical protein
VLGFTPTLGQVRVATIDMLQDFNFKILHRPGLKHTNVDALSRNPVGQATDDDDFSEEIQDIGAM